MEKDKITADQKLVVIGGSAGCLPVILSNIGLLQPTLQLPIILVLHRKADSDNLLEQLLASRTKMKVKEAEDKEPILNGTIYIAPADYHLLIEKGHTLALDYSERLNYSRPCIDATFETAAETYGNNLLAIILSGANADGVEGMKNVKNHGGITAAQNPKTAVVPYMPQKAIKEVGIEHVLENEEIANFISNFSIS